MREHATVCRAALWGLMSVALGPGVFGQPWGGDGAGVRQAVKAIELVGNYRTRGVIVLRELGFGVGDSLVYGRWEEIRRAGEQNLYNLGLFNRVDMGAEWDGAIGGLVVRVVVRERFFLFVVPYATLEERNSFDALRNRNLERLVYGVGIGWRNVFGGNETLLGYGQWGFTRRARVEFTRPWVLARAGVDVVGGFKVIDRKQLLYATRGGEAYWTPVFEDLLIQRDRKVWLRFRKRFTLRRSLYAEATYTNIVVNDTLYDLEAGLPADAYYLPGRRLRESYPSLLVNYVDDQRDILNFPLGGYKLQLLGRVAGLGTSSFVKVGGNFSQYIPLGRGWNVGWGVQHIQTFGYNLPFFEKTFLNLSTQEFYMADDRLRGYQPYTLDGTQVSTLKVEVKYAVVPRQFFRLPVRVPQLSDMAGGLYAGGFCDVGYLRDGTFSNYDQTFKDKLLVGYGLHVYVLALYDRMLRVDVARNREGRLGVYFHGSVGIK